MFIAPKEELIEQSGGFTAPQDELVSQQKPWYQKFAETTERITKPMEDVAPYAPEYAAKISPMAEYPRRILQPVANVGFNALNKGGELAAKKIGAMGHPIAGAVIGTGIQMAPEIAMAADPLIGIGRSAMTGIKGMYLPVAESATNKPLNILARVGARDINATAGIKPSTVLGLAGKSEPSEIGYRLSEWLRTRGMASMRSGEIAKKSIQLESDYGRRVGNAISDIKSAGVDTTVDSGKALQPIVDRWANYAKSALSEGKRKAVPFEQIYNDLSSIAKNSNNRLSLDTIREKMAEVGEQLNGMTDSNPRLAAYEELYGSLANVRDGIVQSVANNVGNQNLKNELLKANKDYSTLLRLQPDIRRSAARETTNKPFSGGIQRATAPYISRTIGAVGRQLSGATELGAKTVRMGVLNRTSKNNVLSKDRAREILTEAGGDPEKARKIARQRGYVKEDGRPY